MENPYLLMLWSALSANAALGSFSLVVFVLALKLLEAKFMPKRRRWRRSSRHDQEANAVGFIHFQPRHDRLPD